MNVLVWWLAAWMAVVSGAAKAASWSATGSMPVARASHTASLLRNGKVLVAGGADGGGYSLASAALYDPATGAWNTVGAMPGPGAGHTATLLLDGKVLVAGGSYFDGSGSGGLFSAALFDLATGTWAATGSMPVQRGGHTASLLPNGKVLVAGGSYWTGFNLTVLASAALYDPATGAWSATGSMPEARWDHTATVLPNGKVLVAGGNRFGTLASALLYDPAKGTWAATGSMPVSRDKHTATLLPNGKVLVAGGWSSDAGSQYLASAALYDPGTGTWAATGSMAAARVYHSATLLPSGKTLVAGGFDGGSYLATAALYDPSTGAWSATDPLFSALDGHTATLLLNGKVLVAGGWDGISVFAAAELYVPDLPDFTVTRITLTPASPALNTGFTAQVTVKNQGTAAGAGGTLAVWTDQGAAQACGAKGGQSVAVGVLAAGGGKTLTFTGLKAATAGTKTFRAFADSACATAEGSEANNQATLSYRVHGAQPDFVVKSVVLNPASPTAGKAFTTSVTVANQGNAPGDAGYLDVWANQPAAQPCEAEGDAWAAVGPLDAGATKTLRLNLVAGTAGAKTFRAFVNSWCGAGESDEGNNQIIKGHTVK
jgi:N-acetylneuraminic acid mutarotase